MAQDRLKGRELRAILRDHWWYGRNPRTGKKHWAFLPKGKEIGIGGAWGSHRGTWNIAGDFICFDWVRYGRTCVPVYRNPEGTRSSNDEYVIALGGGGFAFSTYKERPPALKNK